MKEIVYMVKNRWFDFYKNRINNISYENYFNQKYAIFLTYLAQNIKKNDKTLEIGCGTSLITKSIYRNNIYFNARDNNSKMLELSEINLKNKKVKLGLYDIRHIIKEKYNIIYSHGVLEHFLIKEIKDIINNQLKSSNYLVHYVLSNKYKTKSFGDELLMSKEEWNRLLSPTKIIAFNNEYDLILIWDYRKLY